MNRRQYQFGCHLADVLEIIFEHALFCCHLGTSVHVLHAATATDAKMMAFRRYPRKRGLENLIDLGKLEARFFAIGVIGDNLSWQGAFDENDFAFSVRNAPAFLIQGFDKNGGSHLTLAGPKSRTGSEGFDILPSVLPTDAFRNLTHPHAGE